MKRELKFRAWDKLHNEMWYQAKPGLSGLKNYDILERFEIVMQFTGLFDKNGKEIYEGDIVESVDELSNDEYQVDDRVFTEAVEFNAGAFYPVCNMPSEEFEVIGNIHKNPDLL